MDQTDAEGSMTERDERERKTYTTCNVANGPIKSACERPAAVSHHSSLHCEDSLRRVPLSVNSADNCHAVRALTTHRRRRVRAVRRL